MICSAILSTTSVSSLGEQHASLDELGNISQHRQSRFAGLMWGPFWCRCIPIRWKEGGTLEEVEVLMITSSGGQGLVFPKVRSSKAQLLSSAYTVLATSKLRMTSCRVGGKLMRLSLAQQLGKLWRKLGSGALLR